MSSFRVEYINTEMKHAILIAEQLDDSNFEIEEGSFLGPLELNPILDQPRSTKPDGSQNYKLFTFYPKDRDKMKLVSKEEVLELTIKTQFSGCDHDS